MTKMINRNVMLLCTTILSVIFSMNLMAFPCFFTLVKDSCWVDYAVTVVVANVLDGKTIISLTVPKGQLWNRQAFTCQLGQKFLYTATFEPAIWEGTEGKIYKAHHYWTLPEIVTAKEKAWDIPVCFPTAFAEVPFPPKISGNCKCDFSKVPTIPLQHE